MRPRPAAVHCRQRSARGGGSGGRPPARSDGSPARSGPGGRDGDAITWDRGRRARSGVSRGRPA
eukprot:1194196-Pyramimonas_sp.AAC.1